jgi:cytochrome c-type biogenesis protein CcmH/NrfG
MFKRLFFLSGIIAFVLACALMYFWYLPYQSTSVPNKADQEEVSSLPSDSLSGMEVRQ